MEGLPKRQVAEGEPKKWTNSEHGIANLLGLIESMRTTRGTVLVKS